MSVTRCQVGGLGWEAILPAWAVYWLVWMRRCVLLRYFVSPLSSSLLLTTRNWYDNAAAKEAAWGLIVSNVPDEQRGRLSWWIQFLLSFLFQFKSVWLLLKTRRAVKISVMLLWSWPPNGKTKNTTLNMTSIWKDRWQHCFRIRHLTLLNISCPTRSVFCSLKVSATRLKGQRFRASAQRATDLHDAALWLLQTVFFPSLFFFSHFLYLISETLRVYFFVCTLCCQWRFLIFCDCVHSGRK